ncbi:MAG: hypothetical protein J5506_04070 [Prevotella sp.]|nr:hypothetical protein [Prevotella sp.]
MDEKRKKSPINFNIWDKMSNFARKNFLLGSLALRKHTKNNKSNNGKETIQAGTASG